MGSISGILRVPSKSFNCGIALRAKVILTGGEKVDEGDALRWWANREGKVSWLSMESNPGMPILWGRKGRRIDIGLIHADSLCFGREEAEPDKPKKEGCGANLIEGETMRYQTNIYIYISLSLQ